MFWQFSLAPRSSHMLEQARAQVLGQAPVPEREQDLVLGRVPAPERGLRALVQAQVLELAPVPEPVRLVRVLAAPAWVLGRGQAWVKGALGPVALKVRTAMALAMEPAMTVLVRQTVQALALVTAPVRAGMDRAAAANANLLSLLKGSPHPNPLPQCEG